MFSKRNFVQSTGRAIFTWRSVRWESNLTFGDALERARQDTNRRQSLEERKATRRALSSLNVPSFDSFLQQKSLSLLKRRIISTLQVNIGLYCNQSCNHCHVESVRVWVRGCDELLSSVVYYTCRVLNEPK